jgi:hypothetical protein
MKSSRILTVMAGVFVILFAAAITADAASMRLRCETRNGRRSKVSVDGRDVPSGTYSVVVTSGSSVATDSKRSVGDEVEFDFDSATGENDTPIARDFISGDVTATITGNGVNLTETAGCKAN